ncbi:MAG TPA: hypothetical protein H9985_07275 [Candidatus Anaerofilum faecale]|nr:hypothetical protein [Candidatus Anaerofilum faecale]
MSVSRLEQETIINFNEAESTATVYTHNGALVRKLEGLADQRPDEVKRGRVFPDGGREYTVPKRWVKVNASRILTEEQKAGIVARFKRA